MNIILFTQIYNLSTNSFLGGIALFLHQFTYPILGLILILVLIFSRRKFFTFSFLFLSAVFSWFISETLKFLFHIPRPFVDLEITPLVYQSGFSFPSQHMAVFSALAISMFFINKKASIALLILAVMIGISRIIIGVHYPIDIIGGFCVGLITSFILNYFFKKI